MIPVITRTAMFTRIVTPITARVKVSALSCGTRITTGTPR
jgi:hypothetical protein